MHLSNLSGDTTRQSAQGCSGVLPGQAGQGRQGFCYADRGDVQGAGGAHHRPGGRHGDQSRGNVQSLHITAPLVSESAQLALEGGATAMQFKFEYTLLHGAKCMCQTVCS